MEHSDELLKDLDNALGLGQEDQVLQPPPVALDKTPDGKDELGQEVLDGTLPDELTAGNEEYTQEVLDEEVRVAQQAIETHEMLESFTQKIQDKGSICKADVQQAIDIYPGLNEYIRHVNYFTDAESRVGYEAGLNNMDKAGKLLGGLAIAAGIGALIGLIVKMIMAMKNRLGLSPADYKLTMMTKEDFERQHAEMDREVKEILGKVKNIEAFKLALKDKVVEKFGQVSWTPRQIQNADDAVGDFAIKAILESPKHKYSYLYDALSGGTARGASHSDIQKFITAYTAAMPKVVGDIDSKFKKLQNELAGDSVLKEEDFKGNIGDIDYGLPSAVTVEKVESLAGNPTAILKAATNFLGDLVETNPDAKVKALKEYMKTPLNMKDTDAIGDPEIKMLQAVQVRLNAMKKSAEKLDEQTRDPEIRRSRLKVINEMISYLVALQNTISAINRFRRNVADLNKHISDCKDHILKVYLAAAVAAKPSP